MTATTETPMPATVPPAGETTAGEPTSTEPTAPAPKDHDKDHDREAARYRARLRETEQTVATLTSQLAAARAAAVNATIAGANLGLRNPDDLAALGGFDAASVWRDDGTLDPSQIHTAAAALRTARPELFAPRGPVLADPGKTPETPAKVGGFEQAFAPRAD